MGLEYPNSISSYVSCRCLDIIPCDIFSLIHLLNFPGIMDLFFLWLFLSFVGQIDTGDTGKRIWRSFSGGSEHGLCEKLI